MENNVSESTRKLEPIEHRLETLLRRNPDIFVTDIKNAFEAGNLEDARRLLDEREDAYDKLERLELGMTDIDNKIATLTYKGLNGDRVSAAYKRALEALRRRHHELEAEVWKLRPSIFKEWYDR